MVIAFHGNSKVSTVIQTSGFSGNGWSRGELHGVDSARCHSDRASDKYCRIYDTLENTVQTLHPQLT